jgi:hypothetical protein
MGLHFATQGASMKIFLSWSGDIAKDLAETLRSWLPDVVQSVDPFVSTQDISIGDRPLNVLASELESTSFGIICLTQQNMLTPWITFEAGALSKIVDKGKVIPLLLDLKVSDLTGPLAQFQAINADDEYQMFKLIKSIAAVNPSPSITEDRLKRTFDAFWPILRDKVKELKQRRGGEAEEKTIRSDRALLEELLVLARRNDQETQNVTIREIPALDIVRSKTSAWTMKKADHPRQRWQEIVQELNLNGLEFDAAMSADSLIISINDNDATLDADNLRRLIGALAAEYRTPVEVTSGPFGAQSFPPF